MVSALLCVSCIFDSEPELPLFPSTLAFTVAFETGVDHGIVKCMNTANIALVASGSSLAAIDVFEGELLAELDTGVPIDDIADSDAGGYSYVLAGSMLYPLDLAGLHLLDPVDIGLPSDFVCTSPDGGTAWVSMTGAGLASVDLASMEVSVVEQMNIRDCQGLAAADNSLLFVADGTEASIRAFDTSSWEEVGSIPVQGGVIDLFPGPSGYVCAIVEGSNKLWYIRTYDTSLYRMVTFPEVPAAGASTPSGGHAYASCPGIGTVIAAESGQIEVKTLQYGIPADMDITPDGNRAVLFTPEDDTVYVLKR